MTIDHINQDHVVSIEFELRDGAGEILDSSAASGPLSYLHGHGQLLPEVERELDDKPVGHEASVALTPETGFGERDEQLVFDVPRNMLEFAPEPGQILEAQGPGGITAPFRVVEVGAEKVKLDGNHPMAGKNVTFKVKVVGLRAATPEELSHGHGHGESCGHGHGESCGHGHGGSCGHGDN